VTCMEVGPWHSGQSEQHQSQISSVDRTLKHQLQKVVGKEAGGIVSKVIIKNLVGSRKSQTP
jgi:hypothetical protein